MARDERHFYVYILTNRSGTLYTGSTNDLQRRVWQHKKKLTAGFTSKYNIDRLVYWEDTQDLWTARDREMEVKQWTRAKRIALINQMNPKWVDLAADWYSNDT